MLRELARAASLTLHGVFSYRRLSDYFTIRAGDMFTRMLCMVSLLLADSYGESDLSLVEVGLLDREAILSYTVILVWLRQMRVLKISAYTGAFVYMLGRMVGDVLRWLIIYAFGAVAFSSGLFVLFRTERAALGLKYGHLGEDCDRLESTLVSVSEALQFLFSITLDGGGYWPCFLQASASVPGLLVFCVFMVIMILMLLNTLIAMMAETYSAVSESSFKNYAASFGKVLVSQRCRVQAAVPLNLLTLPYYVGRLVWSVLTITKTVRRANSTVASVRQAAARATPGLPSFAPLTPTISSIQRGRIDVVRMAAFAEKLTASTHDQRDPAVVQKINDIRRMVLKDTSTKHHFERQIARFCSVQDEAEDPVAADEIRDIISDTVSALLDEKLEAFLGKRPAPVPRPLDRSENRSPTEWLDEPLQEATTSVQSGASESAPAAAPAAAAATAARSLLRRGSALMQSVSDDQQLSAINTAVRSDASGPGFFSLGRLNPFHVRLPIQREAAAAYAQRHSREQGAISCPASTNVLVDNSIWPTIELSVDAASAK